MAVQGWTIALPDENATRRLGVVLGQHLPVGSIVLLLGDLGSGKTTLAQGLGQGLGIAEPIISPTFTLINEYPEGRLPLYHMDLYRLDPAETDALHLETYWDEMEFPPGIVAIEWPERLLTSPSNYLEIRLTPSPQGGRCAQLRTMGHLAVDVAQLLNSFEPYKP